MSIQEKQPFTPMNVSADQVEEYLKEHPDFFRQHTELLAHLQIPHPSGKAVSLLEYQNSILRDQTGQLKKKLMELVSHARENDRLNDRVMRLTLDLIESRSLEEMLHNLEEHLRSEFNAAFIRLVLFQDDKLASQLENRGLQDREDPALNVFENFFKTNRPLCGRLKGEQLQYLFPESAAQIESAVLMPLGRHGKEGMIAIGSEDSKRFHPSMGTIFLNQMGSVISACIRRYTE